MEAIEVIEHNGYRIEIHRDDNAADRNPLNADFANGISGIIYSSYPIEVSNGGIELPTLTDENVNAHSKEICEALGVSGLLDIPRAYKAMFGCSPAPYAPVSELVNELYVYAYHNHRDSMKMDMLAGILDIAGIKHFRGVGNGYAQGDWHAILLAMDPKVESEFGDPEEALAGLASEFCKWRYGDVHGYMVKKPTTCQCCGNTTYELVDSCWGFISSRDDDSWKYMVEEAKENCE